MSNVPEPKIIGIYELAKNYKELESDPVNINRYLPDKTVINSNPIGYITQPLFSTDNIYSRFTMLPGTHSGETCALNAGLISANQEYQNTINILNGTTLKNTGFFLEIYNGYFWDNVDYFDKNSPIYTSNSTNPPNFSTQYNSITSVTNNKIIIESPASSPSIGALLNTWDQYSIRLTGVFVFDHIGTWTFSTTSDDSSVIWIGEKAITGITTSNINLNNDGGHGMRTVVYQYEVSEVGEQPIKLMMGNGGGPSGLIFQYQAPGWSNYANAAQYNGTTYIKCYTHNGQVVNNQVYYALIGDATTGQLKCGIYGNFLTNKIQQGFLQTSISSMDTHYLKDNIGDFQEVVAWEIIDPNSKTFTPNKTKIHLIKNYTTSAFGEFVAPGSLVIDINQGMMLISFNNNNKFINARLNFNSGSYRLTNEESVQYLANYPDLKNAYGNNLEGGKDHYQIWGINEGRQYANAFSASIGSDGHFYVKDSKGGVIWSLDEVPNSSDSFQNTMANIHRISKSTFDQIVNAAIVNPKWIELVKKGAPDTIYMDDFLANPISGLGGLPYLISKNGKFKIQVSDSGNLVLVITKKVNTRTFTESNNPYIYTTYDDKSAHLYSSHAPATMGKTFSLEKDEDGNTNLLEVDTKSKFLSYNVSTSKNGTMNYTKYPKYYPTSTKTTDSAVNNDACAAKCSTDEKCLFYYSYKKSGTDYCQTSGKDDYIIFATTPDENMTNSDLYLKNPNVLFNAILSDPYNKENNAVNTVAHEANAKISTNPYEHNQESQITDPEYTKHFYNIQATLTNGSPPTGVTPVDQHSSKKIDVANTLNSDSSTNPNSVTAAANTSNAAGVTSHTVALSSTTITIAPSTSNHIGEGFTSYSLPSISGISDKYTNFPDASQKRMKEGFKEGIDDPNSGDSIHPITNIPMSNVPTIPSDISTITPVGGVSNLYMAPTSSGFSNPTITDLINKDLVHHHMIPNANGTTKGELINFGDMNMKQSNEYDSTTNIQFMPFNNNDHPAYLASGYDHYPMNPQYLQIQGGYQPPTNQGQHSLGITFSFWVCSSYNKTYARIFDFGDTNGGNGKLILTGFIGEYLLFVVLNRPYSDTVVWLNGLNWNNWNHVVWTMTPDGVWKIYVNGALASYQYWANMGYDKNVTPQNPAGGGATYPDPTHLMPNCFIGHSNWWCDPYFNGGMSDFRIYNGLLSEPEIGYLYNSSYMNYNTNTVKASIGKGIYMMLKLDLRSVWHWGMHEEKYSLIRSLDGTTGTLNWGAATGMFNTHNDRSDDSSTIENTYPIIVADHTIANGYCLKLNGRHYLKLAPCTLPSNGMTISLWIKVAPGTSPTWSRVFDFGNGQSNDNIVMAIYQDSIAIHVERGGQTTWWDGRNGDFMQVRPDWYGVIKTFDNTNRVNITPIANDQWHHLVWVMTNPDSYGNCQWIIYLDGVKQPALPQGLYPSPNELKKCYIGKSNWGWDRLVRASLSDFRIYSKILNQNEVSMLYNIGSMTTNIKETFSGSKDIEGFSILGSNLSSFSYKEGLDSIFNNRDLQEANFKYYGYSSSANNNQNIVNGNGHITYGGADFTYTDLQDNVMQLGILNSNYNKLYSDLSHNYYDISGIVSNYIDICGQLMDPRYNFGADAAMDNIDDITNPGHVNSTQNVLKEDIQQIILQENTIYTVGVITCATLLISALLLSSKR